MKTSPDRLRRRFAAQLANTGTAVTLSWIVHTGGTTDPVTGARLGSVDTVQTLSVIGLVHQVSGEPALRQHAEIEAGDLLLDLPCDVAIDGKDGLQFTIDSRLYRLKPISGKLAKAWDLLVRGQRLTRTLLLEPAL